MKEVKQNIMLEIEAALILIVGFTSLAVILLLLSELSNI
jgi:hypothetical protein